MIVFKYGFRLGTITEYAHMLLPIEEEVDECWINHVGMVSAPNIDQLIPVATSSGYYRFLPGPEFSPRIYRGQNQFFNRCLPSIHRQDIRNIDALFWIAKTIELAVLLEQHPAKQDLAAHQIDGLNFAFNIEAIAQHYQYPTPLLDFSRSKDVAMFFATCAYDEKTNIFTPLKSGTAVLYTADLRELILQRGITPLGMEPLPRPEAQRAMAVRISPSENLNDMPWVYHSLIEITPNLSSKYFEMFDGGNKLFPQNPFDGKIQELRTNRTVPLQALEFGIQQGLLPAHPNGISGAQNEILSAGYIVEDREISISSDVIVDAAIEWDKRKVDYFGRISIRPVSDAL